MLRTAAAIAIVLCACERTERVDPPLLAAPASARTVETTRRDRVFAEARARGLRGARELERRARELETATSARDQESARRACLELRRAWREVEPVARLLAPVAASQLDTEEEEPDEMPTRVGLRVVADFLASKQIDWPLVEHSVRSTVSAARLGARELETASWDFQRVLTALSRAVFEWGRRLDGSRAELDGEVQVDVLDGGRALVAWISLIPRLLASAPGVSGELEASLRSFESWLNEHGAAHDAKLDGLIASGRMGAAVRRSAVVLGIPAPSPPFLPARPLGSQAHSEPVQIATFPRLRGAPPRADRVALGAELFFDSRLSQNGKLSCASCHRVDRDLAFGAARPLMANGRPTPREVPSLWNVAYEAMQFWDGRASTLDAQVRIAVEEDMHGDWDRIVERLSTDRELDQRFRNAFGQPLAAPSIRAAIAEFERTLIRDGTPLDRYVRGEKNALSAEMQAGFDVYFGKALCSRCHRLPLTSGTMPPRFSRGEASAIGVPLTAGSRKLDPDRGRGAATGLALDEHAFKVPSLRNLASSAPYFHNGAMKTLEQVVDFYEKGSGQALGIELENFDPDARAFELTPRERRALIVFLRDGLREPSSHKD